MKRVLAAVDGVTKFNLWLVPSEVMACCTPRTHRSSLLPHLIGLTPSLTPGPQPFRKAVNEVITRLSTQHDRPSFPPHVTIGNSFRTNQVMAARMR